MLDFGLRRREISRLIGINMPEPYVVSLGDKSIAFDCPTDIAFNRAKWLLMKEPGTISWIDSFDRGSVFWDIGANVGVYSLYAAVMRGCRVLAFEPGAANYQTLNRNIHMNGLDRQIQALCVCVGESTLCDFLYLHDINAGAALHNFGENIDYKGDRFRPAAVQGAIAVPIDVLVRQFAAPFPNYMKIDVDGNELGIVRGGVQTFRDARVRSVLVEVNLNDEKTAREIASILAAEGLHRDDHIRGNLPRALGDARIYNLICRR
jgi:FkbM family methyltransferase